MAAHHAAGRAASIRLWWPWLLVTFGWATAIVATLAGLRPLIDHHYLLEQSGLPWPVAALVFLTCWQVMIVAMMIPASLPLPGGTRQAIPTRVRRAPEQLIAGDILVWSVFGLLAFSGDTLIHRLVDNWPWLAAHAYLIGATTFAIAGLFQFSRWKIACLATCRTPPAHQEPFWAWRGGFGQSCASVGCCWALMLVMFGVGVGGLGWMVGLTAAMESEVVAPAGWRVRQVVGIALLALAGLWLAHPAWLVPAAAP